MKTLGIAIIIQLGGTTGVLAQSGPTVNTLNGTLQGSKCLSSDVNAFLSIPFAESPVGDLRFASPQPLDRTYNGTLNATKLAPACPQFNSAFAEWTAQSEDCLFINVWTPSNATAESKLPVKVWLYGGANQAGGISNPLYDGCFASSSVIQVSINYRVGPLGFLAFENLGITGNYGVQDQLLGLRWVQENIAAFGGDPTKVLLFGQSAGGLDAFVISSLPQAKSLMRAAIIESGAFLSIPTLADASKGNQAFIESLNCSTTDIGCLRSVSVDTLNRTTTAMANPLGVIVDGKTVPSTPTTPKVPSIIGTTANEASLLLLAQFQANAFTLNQSSYDSYLTGQYGANAALVNQTYPITLFAGSPNPAFEAMSTVFTHSTFRCPARRLLVSATVPVWTYNFNHTPSCAWYQQIPNLALVLQLLGAAHTAEIPFVFGQVNRLPLPDGTCNFTVAEKELSVKMLAAWDNMARDGTPGEEWPMFNKSESKGISVEGDTWEVAIVDYSMCDFWDKLQGVSGTNGTSIPSGTTASGIAPTVTANGAMKGSAMPGLAAWSVALPCLLWLY
ncbi:alpha/beta-hydrolase [Thozetella sp. PMI_491]|nr:alpha/beta-hydrolase [Thozetella sp. PMI_491]